MVYDPLDYPAAKAEQEAAHRRGGSWWDALLAVVFVAVVGGVVLTPFIAVGVAAGVNIAMKHIFTADIGGEEVE